MFNEYCLFFSVRMIGFWNLYWREFYSFELVKNRKLFSAKRWDYLYCNIVLYIYIKIIIIWCNSGIPNSVFRNLCFSNSCTNCSIFSKKLVKTQLYFRKLLISRYLHYAYQNVISQVNFVVSISCICICILKGLF